MKLIEFRYPSSHERAGQRDWCLLEPTRRRWPRLIMLILLALLIAGVVVAFADDWPGLVPSVRKQIPRIEILKDGTEQIGTCSGVVINAKAGFLLSAAHCVEGKPEELSITVNGRHAEVARVNRILDLAVLRFSPRDETAMVLADKTPDAGTPVGVAGYMFGAKVIKFQFGYVSGRGDDGIGVVVDGVVLPGDSGGAIFDSQGRLVAMSNMYYRGTAIGLAVPIEAVRDFAEMYLEKPVSK